MKLWIIGKRGMLAQSFRRICHDKEIECIATSRKEVDVRDRQAVIAQFKTLDFTHVVNCAAYTAIERAEKEREEAHALNVEAVELLAMLAKEHKKKLMHFSTGHVFDGEREGGYTETCFPRPFSVYGKTKEEGERKLFDHYPQACLVRTSWLFGKEGSNFVTMMRTKMKQSKQVEVPSDQKGRPTFCDDLVEAALRLLDAKGVFHFANRGVTSLYDWACAIHAVLKQQGEIACEEVVPVTSTDLKKEAKYPRFSILETEKYESRMASCLRHWEEPLSECLLK